MSVALQCQCTCNQNIVLITPWVYHSRSENKQWFQGHFILAFPVPQSVLIISETLFWLWADWICTCSAWQCGNHEFLWPLQYTDVRSTICSVTNRGILVCNSIMPYLHTNGTLTLLKGYTHEACPILARLAPYSSCMPSLFILLSICMWSLLLLLAWHILILNMGVSYVFGELRPIKWAQMFCYKGYDCAGFTCRITYIHRRNVWTLWPCCRETSGQLEWWNGLAFQLIYSEFEF